MSGRRATGGVTLPGLSKRTKTAIYDHIFSNDDHEVGGVLVGHLGESTLPTVTGSIAALEARGERASVTFTHDAWASVHEQLERKFAGQQIVGWYHSHPGFGIFLSRHDLFIHENFFSDPRQIAYVVDPHAGTEGVFGWRGGQVVTLEECPSGRAGTGGVRIVRSAPAKNPSMGPVIALAVILGLMCGAAAELILHRSSSSARAPLSPVATQPVATPPASSAAPAPGHPATTTPTPPPGTAPGGG